MFHNDDIEGDNKSKEKSKSWKYWERCLFDGQYYIFCWNKTDKEVYHVIMLGGKSPNG